jgi:TRAP-type uncharacterized transport system fused permease subunit
LAGQRALGHPTVEYGASGRGTASMTFKWSHADVFRVVVVAVSFAMALYHMWAIAFGSPEAIPYRGTHLLFALVLVFLLYRFRSRTEEEALTATPDEASRANTPTPIDYALLLVGAAPILYLFVNYEYVVTRIFYVDDLTPMDMTMGVLMTVIVLEATRRVIGWALPITAIRSP